MKSPAVLNAYPVFILSYNYKGEEVDLHPRLFEHVTDHGAVTPRRYGNRRIMRMPFTQIYLFAFAIMPGLIDVLLRGLPRTVEEPWPRLVKRTRMRRLFNHYARVCKYPANQYPARLACSVGLTIVSKRHNNIRSKYQSAFRLKLINGFHGEQTGQEERALILREMDEKDDKPLYS